MADQSLNQEKVGEPSNIQLARGLIRGEESSALKGAGQGSPTFSKRLNPDKQDKAPEKVRIKDSYRERIEAESEILGKSYLETLYFIIDCYFAFKKGAFPIQQPLPTNTAQTLINSNHRVIASSDNTPVSPQSQKQDSGGETFRLDWDL